jgi:hypothetical protein
MPARWLNARAVVTILLTGIIGALLGVGVGVYIANMAQPWYRAEMQLALLPGPSVPPEEISNYWEALSRGQAPRIAAEVLDQPRWIPAAAKAADVSEGSVLITAGVITDTTLITAGGEAPSAEAAEAAVTAAVQEATPLAQSVSGPFVLQVVQPAQGTAVSQTTPASQVIALAGLAGAVVGVGASLLFVRRRAAKDAARGPGGGSGQRGLAPRAPLPPQAPPRPDGHGVHPQRGGLRPGPAPVAPQRER